MRHVELYMLSNMLPHRCQIRADLLARGCCQKQMFALLGHWLLHGCPEEDALQLCCTNSVLKAHNARPSLQNVTVCCTLKQMPRLGLLERRSLHTSKLSTGSPWVLRLPMLLTSDRRAKQAMRVPHGAQTD